MKDGNDLGRGVVMTFGVARFKEGCFEPTRSDVSLAWSYEGVHKVLKKLVCNIFEGGVQE
jgi:hypothetical protein